MEKRLGVVGVILDDPSQAPFVNEILHVYSHLIIGRMGIPYREKNVSVISLIIDGTSDEISAMTGRLGKLEGVNVKSALAKKSHSE